MADEKLESILPLQKLLIEAIEQDAQVLIIAREFGAELLADLLSNVKQGVFRLVAATAPEQAEQYVVAISILTGGARILGGGTTEIEMFECKRNMEQALAAMRSAQRDGVVPGGGRAYLAASRALEPLLLRAERDKKYDF